MPRQRGDEDYQIRLGQVLRSRDVARLRAFLEANAARYGGARQVEEIRQKSDEEMAALMHRMIVVRNDLADLHPASRRWLFEHGMDSYGQGGGRRN